MKFFTELFKSKKEILIRIILPVAFVFLAGLLIGKITGRHFIINIITKNSTLPLILFRPAFEVYRTYTLVNSNEPLERLSGYYSMLDNNIINADFLYDRLQKEKYDFIKRNIIWIMGQSDDLDATIRIYSSAYDGGGPAVRKEILSTLRKKGGGIYDEFIKNNKIKNLK